MSPKLIIPLQIDLATALDDTCRRPPFALMPPRGPHASCATRWSPSIPDRVNPGVLWISARTVKT